MLIKEFVQLRRDRVTFAHHDLHPGHAAAAVRLRHQHHAAPAADRRAGARGQRPDPLDPGGAAATPATSASPRRAHAKPRWITGCARAPMLFGVEIPAGFERSVRRGDMPALLVAADASDPVAAGTALGALEGVVQYGAGARPRPARDHPERAGLRDPPAPALQSGRRHQPQHRAGAARHHPHHDHADLHGAVGDARGRARHHGEPARHADQAARDHARQDRALRRHRLHPGGADHRVRRADLRGADRPAASCCWRR